MANTKKLLDKFIGSMPGRTYVRRFYNASEDEIPEILERGIVARGPAGMTRRDINGPTVRTSVNKDLLTGKGPVQVEMEIPKDWYRENAVDVDGGKWTVPYETTQRHVDEPYLGPEYPETWRDKQLLGVDDGGRINRFDSDIPRQFIKRIHGRNGVIRNLPDYHPHETTHEYYRTMEDRYPYKRGSYKTMEDRNPYPTEYNPEDLIRLR